MRDFEAIRLAPRCFTDTGVVDSMSENECTNYYFGTWVDTPRCWHERGEDLILIDDVTTQDDCEASGIYFWGIELGEFKHDAEDEGW